MTTEARPKAKHRTWNEFMQLRIERACQCLYPRLSVQ
jgi:hypothetical protein